MTYLLDEDYRIIEFDQAGWLWLLRLKDDTQWKARLIINLNDGTIRIEQGSFAPILSQADAP